MESLGNLLKAAFPQQSSHQRNLPAINVSLDELLGAIESIVIHDGRESFCAEAIQRQANVLAEWLRGEGECAEKDTVFLWGNVGTGKTTILRAVRLILERRNKVMHIFHAVTMCDLAATNIQEFVKEQTTYFLGIDDLGEEPEKIMNFGTPIYPIRSLLERRYSLCLPTFISANISPEHVRERYGERVADRMGQIAFSLSFPGESLRTSQDFY